MEILSNVEYEVEITEGREWLAADDATRSEPGLSTSEHRFTVGANSELLERSATVVFKDLASDLQDEVTVVQAAMADPDPERTALRAIYREANGDDWTNSDNWCTEKPLGEWYGVATDDEGHVVELRLPQNNLRGAIAHEIANLGHLRILDLSRNELECELVYELPQDGTVRPDFWDYFRCDLDDLKLLEEIDLSHNKLYTSTNVPPSFREMNALRRVDLSYNRLECWISADTWRPMFENGRTVDMILNGNRMFEKVHDFIQNHPEWDRLAMQLVRQYVYDIGYERTCSRIYLHRHEDRGAAEHTRLVQPKRAHDAPRLGPDGREVDPVRRAVGTALSQALRGAGPCRGGHNARGRSVQAGGRTVSGNARGGVARSGGLRRCRGAQNHSPFRTLSELSVLRPRGKAGRRRIYRNILLWYGRRRTAAVRPHGEGIPVRQQYEFDMFQDIRQVHLREHGLLDGQEDRAVAAGDARQRGRSRADRRIFTDVDIETGFYKDAMVFAMESFFSVEPTKTYREYFNVHMVYAVSKRRQLTRNRTDSALWTIEDSANGIDGSLGTVDNYAAATGTVYPNRITCVVVNAHNAALTYINVDLARAIAYSGFSYNNRWMLRRWITHEAIGHALGWLGDEYSSSIEHPNPGEIPQNEKAGYYRINIAD